MDNTRSSEPKLVAETNEGRVTRTPRVAALLVTRLIKKHFGESVSVFMEKDPQFPRISIHGMSGNAARNIGFLFMDGTSAISNTPVFDRIVSDLKNVPAS